jgi:hypothetical protein
MARVFFVTGKGGFESLQQRGALLKSNGGSSDVLNLSLMRSVTMPPPSDDLHNVLLAKRPDAIPDENNITAQGILEKSQSKAAFTLDCLQAYLTDAVVGALGEFGCNSNATQPMR